MSTKQVYEGHSFKEEKKEIVQPPIEVLAGGFLPCGMRDLTDWEKWKKDQQKRNDEHLMKKAIEIGDKGLFLKALKGKSIAQKTKMRFDQCMRDRPVYKRGGNNTNNESHHHHHEDEKIVIFKDQESFRYITEAKPMDSGKNKVSVFVDATNIFSEHKAPIYGTALLNDFAWASEEGHD